MRCRNVPVATAQAKFTSSLGRLGSLQGKVAMKATQMTVIWCSGYKSLGVGEVRVPFHVDAAARDMKQIAQRNCR